MAIIYAADGFLGLNLWNVLFHLINFILLLILIRILLYKPVKKFMDNRTAKYQAQKEEADKLNAEAKANIERTDTLLADATKKYGEVDNKVFELTQERVDEILTAAEKDAVAIRAKAHRDAAEEKVKIKLEIEEEVSSQAVELAGKILGREISAKDNADIIDENLKSWSSK